MNIRHSEFLVQDWLRKINIEFESQFEIPEARDRGLLYRFDVVLPAYRIVIEIDNCVEHGHGCQPKIPTGILSRRERDRFVDRVAIQLGWKMIRRWECQILSDPGCIADDKRYFGPTAWCDS